jgi:hypothetical protein
MASAQIATLIGEIPNVHQQESLRRLMIRDEDYQMYMSSYTKTPEDDWAHNNIQGIFNVLGTMKKGVRSEYNIKLYKPGTNAKGSFWCSCPEHKFQSTKKQIVCKHICFLVCRVGRMYNADFFNAKQFSQEKFNEFVNKVEGNPNLMHDPTICKSASTVLTTNTMFKSRTKEINEDDVCAICFDNMIECKDHYDEKIVSCPECHNNIHTLCMEVWLERSKSCMYCRSDVWCHYKKHC